MEIAKLQVSGTSVKIIRQRPVPAGLIGGYITVEYTDELWAGLTKTVVFRGLVTRDVVTDGDRVDIPWEVVAAPKKEFKVGFYGTRTDGTLAVPTFYASLGMIIEAADPSGDPGTDPSLPVYAQLAERVEVLEQGGGGGSGGVGPQGPQGEPGYTPVKGVDYWTTEDKQEIVSDVLAALPEWEGGSY